MRIYIIPLLAVSLTALLALPACGGRQAPETVDRRASEGFRDFFTDDHLLLRRYDSSGDNTPDVFKYYRLIDERGEDIEDTTGFRLAQVGRTRLVRAEFDLDHNGTIDMVRHYDARERLRREEIDSREAGRRSVVTYFEGGAVVRREIDTTGDGRINQTMHYMDSELTRIEFDDEGNGQANRWHFFDGGRLVRIGYDRTGDGIIDEREVLQVTTRSPRDFLQ